jgi:hypothetical protein
VGQNPVRRRIASCVAGLTMPCDALHREADHGKLDEYRCERARFSKSLASQRPSQAGNAAARGGRLRSVGDPFGLLLADFVADVGERTCPRQSRCPKPACVRWSALRLRRVGTDPSAFRPPHASATRSAPQTQALGVRHCESQAVRARCLILPSAQHIFCASFTPGRHRTSQ